MRYAFDFDGVLTDSRMQELYKKLKKEKNEIWIVTARKENEFNRNILKPIIYKLFVPFSNIIFCNDKPKVEMLQAINADIYIDNLNTEFEDILNYTNTIPLLFQSKN